MAVRDSFLSGVVEGFYGQPWSHNNRLHLIQSLRKWNLNSYLYAPKFDLKHRLFWYKSYSKEEISQFRELIKSAEKSSVNFIPAISPGLSFDFKNSEHFQHLLDKYIQFLNLGVTSFALLLDDIPVSNAKPEQHCELIHFLKRELPKESFWIFCPTIYSDWHLDKYENADSYIDHIASNLDSSIYILWTGTSIISPDLTIDHLWAAKNRLKHKLILWDNISADDYTSGHIIFPGPWDRDWNTVDAVDGIFLNPSQYYYASLPAIITMGHFLKKPPKYNPDEAWDKAITELSPNPSKAHILKYILGYYYSIRRPSPLWQSFLLSISKCLDSGERSTENTIQHIKEIQSILKKDENLADFGSIWQELYPFIRTLLGDIDYLLSALNNFQSNRRIHIRDKKWHTLIERIIVEIFYSHYSDDSERTT